MASKASEAVKVMVRIRPMNTKEKERGNYPAPPTFSEFANLFASRMQERIKSRLVN